MNPAEGVKSPRPRRRLYLSSILKREKIANEIRRKTKLYLTKYLMRYDFFSPKSFESTSSPANKKSDVIPICPKNLKSSFFTRLGSKEAKIAPMKSAVTPEGILYLKKILGTIRINMNISK